MATLRPNYDAYLLRTWREEPVREALPPTCYYLVEQLFGARQRWLFTDAVEFHKHLQKLLPPSPLPARHEVDG